MSFEPFSNEDELNRFVAVAIADHIDVIGDFPGMDGHANGFLSSGSEFRRPQLSALYRAIAPRIEAVAAAPPPAARAQSSI